MKKRKISDAVVRRLPRYYRYLDDLHSKGIVRISSSSLGERMGITASQIRQDLSCFGEFGQQGYGYNVDVLREEIGNILGVNRGHTIVVVGAGNLGKALMGNFKFSHIGFRLAAAFDINEKTVGTTIAGTPVYHEDQLEGFVRSHHVDVGLLAVPRPVAQSVADKLVNAGVKGIWNFTNQELFLPGHEDVIVESVHFSKSLLALSYMISQEEDEEKGAQE